MLMHPKKTYSIPNSKNFKKLGTVYKTSAVKGSRFVQCGHFADTGGGLQMRTSALFGAKKLVFFRNLWCVRTDKGRSSQCGHYAGQRGGVNFSRLCADVFYGWPLS